MRVNGAFIILDGSGQTSNLPAAGVGDSVGILINFRDGDVHFFKKDQKIQTVVSGSQKVKTAKFRL